MMDHGGAFDGIVSVLQPHLHQHGFRRADQLDAGVPAGVRHAAFASGEEAVRLAWHEDAGFVVLEALEPEFGGTWTDMLLRLIDLRRADEPDLARLVEVLREELGIYLDQVDRCCP